MSRMFVFDKQGQESIAPVDSMGNAAAARSRMGAPAILARIILVALVVLAAACTWFRIPIALGEPDAESGQAMAQSTQLVADAVNQSGAQAGTLQASAPQPVQSHQPLDWDKWEARMPLPSDSQIEAYQTDMRSPYLVCWPQFPGENGYGEYAVDFRADSQPRGTYVNIGSWWMDTRELESRYVTLSGDEGRMPGGCYAGFQILEDGSKVAIFSVWNINAVDENGNETVIRATRTYPENPRVGGNFGGEGTGIQTLVDYNWQAGRTYRALIQCGRTEAGNCELMFYVCDLTTGRWDKLAAYDLGYGNTYITTVGCFLENFVPDYAAEIRTMELSNFRVNSRSMGGWVSATTAVWERQFEAWPGSYAYGSDDTCFWAVTSGIPGLCEPPANYVLFSVAYAQEGMPYE